MSERASHCTWRTALTRAGGRSIPQLTPAVRTVARRPRQALSILRRESFPLQLPEKVQTPRVCGGVLAGPLPRVRGAEQLSARVALADVDVATLGKGQGCGSGGGVSAQEEEEQEQQGEWRELLSHHCSRLIGRK